MFNYTYVHGLSNYLYNQTAFQPQLKLKFPNTTQENLFFKQS